MGLFDKLKGAQQVAADAAGLAGQAEAAQAQMAGVGAGSAAADYAKFSNPIGDEELAPIAGVSLEQYAQVSKQMAGRSADEVDGIVAAAGIDSASWNQALTGWNDRMGANPAIAIKYSEIYGAV